MCRRGRRGFTLIELLVVVSILGLLTAFMTPMARRARIVSRRTKCLANLHSVGQALQNYMYQSNDTYPCAAEMRSIDRLLAEQEKRQPWPALSEVLLPHAGNVKEVFACPADRRVLHADDPHEAMLLADYPADTTYFATEGLSYEWRSQYNGKQPHRDIFTDPHGLKLGPASAPLLYDFEPFHGRAHERGTMCMLFADLHAAPDDYQDDSAP